MWELGTQFSCAYGISERQTRKSAALRKSRINPGKHLFTRLCLLSNVCPYCRCDDFDFTLVKREPVLALATCRFNVKPAPKNATEGVAISLVRRGSSVFTLIERPFCFKKLGIAYSQPDNSLKSWSESTVMDTLRVHQVVERKEFEQKCY